MPCPHCPHCREEERVRREIHKMLAQFPPDSQNPVPIVASSDSQVDSLDEKKEEEEEEVPLLRPEQKSIAEQICNTIMEQKFHFIGGIAGSGKSYLLDAISILMRKLRLNVVVLATSQHMTKSGHTMYEFLKKSEDELEDVDVILVDNVNTVPDVELFKLSSKFNRAMNTGPGVLFGGKGVVLAGDYGQCLPFCKEKTRCTLKHFTSGDKFKKHVLPTGADEWSQWLSEIRKSPKIGIPAKYIVKDLKTLVNKVFGDVYFDAPEDGVILTTTKAKVEEVNREVLSRMSGRMHVFEALFNDNTIRGDLDFHELSLKDDAILILEEAYEGVLRNTRLRFESPNESGSSLSCRVMEGPHKGKPLDVKRVKRNLAAHLGESQQWVRQFPVALAFAMTIYGSQGKRFDRVGCFKLDTAFEHGQVYTAISRCSSGDNLHILSTDDIIPNKIDLTLL